MNLGLAILWLAGGVALLAGHHSTGWLMLLLSAYNLIRWWSLRSSRAEREFRLALASRRSRHFHDRPPERTIDPTFDFTRDPPPADGV
jgi:hypothetical protein